MKKIIVLGLLLLFVSCEKDNSLLDPSTTGTIKIVLDNSAQLSQLEVRVLTSDNSVLVSKTFQPVNNSFNVSLNVRAQNDLKVLCLGKFNGIVGYFGIDDDVDVQAGTTTTAIIEGWNDAYIPEIGAITPNPSPDGSYTVSWMEAPNASIYTLQEANNNMFAGAKTVYSGTDLNKYFSGKTTGTYYYQVHASNIYNINSSWSDYKFVVVDLSVPVHTLSGAITGTDGVVVTLSGDATGSRIVNDGGTYSFNIAEGGTYTIKPAKTDFTFIPASHTFNNVTSNQSQNFMTSLYTYTISGAISGADNVTVTLSGDAFDSQVVATDGGSYSFAVAHGGSYTVTPTKHGYEFTPASQTFNNMTGDETQNYSAHVVLTVEIPFISDRDGTRELYIMDYDGSNQTRITDNNLSEFYPRLSPDGTTVVFHTRSDDKSKFDIYTININGTNLRRLTYSSYNLQPSWSPGGSQIVYIANEDGGGGIFTMNSDGTDKKDLGSIGLGAYRPSWSPDGRQIAYSYFTDNWDNENIRIMDSKGSSRTILTNGNNDMSPSFSPDGTEIVYFSHGEIFIMNSDGSNKRQLTNNTAKDDIPLFLDDVSRIIFHSDIDGNYEIYSMNKDGSDQQNLTNNQADDMLY